MRDRSPNGQLLNPCASLSVDDARSGGRIRDAILGAVDPAAGRTVEDGRTVLWPAGQAPCDIAPFRPSAGVPRSHADVPLAELAGLAQSLRSATPEGDIVRLIAAAFGLSRIEVSTRSRFEAAAARAEAHGAARDEDLVPPA